MNHEREERQLRTLWRDSNPNERCERDAGENRKRDARSARRRDGKPRERLEGETEIESK